MFEVIIHLETIAKVETFGEAFRLFFHEVTESVREGTSWQVLETTNFIAFTEDGFNHVMEFDDVRHAGNVMGLVNDGKLVENAPEPDQVDVADAFHKVTRRRTELELEVFVNMLKKAGKALEAAADCASGAPSS